MRLNVLTACVTRPSKILFRDTATYSAGGHCLLYRSHRVTSHINLLHTAPSRTAAAKPMTNRLVNERSPYLLQHAHNPVQWYPWGDEAFEKAKSTNRPIFLSVGYSTCHWCHVMAHESFENVHTASILNEHFVSVKVDREERPDVDKLYMTVVQALTGGGGGWPMSVFLTPDLKPITGGTYFPPDDRYGRPGFPKILTLIADKWRTDNEAVRNQGDTLTSAMSRLFVVERGAIPNADDVASECYSHLADSFDEVHKGFGSAPKFPKPAELDFMLAFYAANKSTAEGRLALKMVGETLEAMARGGIHDHIGLGFHRYSVDGAWHVPHFEKMLYDQAQLLSVYANASLIRSDMEKYAEDIAEYVHRNLTHPEGGFYSAEDADSLPSHEETEKREGAAYVWTQREIDDALKEITLDGDGDVDVAKCFKQYFTVQPNGNCPNHTDPHGELKWQNVLIMKDSHDGYATRLGISPVKLSEVISKARDALISVRSQRPKPHLDDKMLTAWNGLMISGLSRASIALRKPELAERASKAINFVRKYLIAHEDGQLLRACYADYDGNVVLNSKATSAFADDYAFLIEGLLNLYEAKFDEQLLKLATTLQQQMDNRFWDREKNSGFFLNEADPSILMRVVEEQDGAEPSTNSVAAGNLVRLANIFDKESYRLRANNILEGAAKRLDEYPVMLPKMVSALLTHARPGCMIVVCGSRDDPVAQQMLEEIGRSFLPNKSIVSLDPDKDLWLFEQNEHFKTLMGSAEQPTVFICENFTCKTPITSLDGLKNALLSI